MEKAIVVVRVSGGVVEEAYGTPSTRVVVIDHDGGADTPGEANIIVFEDPLPQAALVDSGEWEEVLAAIDAGTEGGNGAKQYELTPKTCYTGGLAGPTTEGRPVRFSGREIAYDTNAGRDSNGGTSWRVYETVAGKIIVAVDDWNCWEGSRNDYTVHVFDDLDSVPKRGLHEWEGEEAKPGAIPDCVRVQAEEALGRDPAITVD